MRGLGTAVLAAALLVGLLVPSNAGALGRRAPDFTLLDLDGRKVTLSNLYGKGPILISLWALWCRPCLEELPHLDALYEELRDRGVEVLAVSQDSPRSQNRVKAFIKSKKYDFRVLRDPNGELARKLKTRVIPYTVILDSDGQIVHARTGYRKGQEAELMEILVDLLEEREAAESR